ncbi:MAG: hypothetical protein HRU15_00780 [Planctomycetes bacterium]|nr:hypothetical protein [Planctomycetota bacterium]
MAASGVVIQVSHIIDREQQAIAEDDLRQIKRMLAAGVRIALVDQVSQQELENRVQALSSDTEFCALTIVGLEDKASFVWPKAGQLLRAAKLSEMDIFSSWLIASEEAAFHAASQAGFLGGVFVENKQTIMPDSQCGLQVLNTALSLSDAPRVMIPPQGGCWHDHQ